MVSISVGHRFVLWALGEEVATARSRIATLGNEILWTISDSGILGSTQECITLLWYSYTQNSLFLDEIIGLGGCLAHSYCTQFLLHYVEDESQGLQAINQDCMGV